MKEKYGYIMKRIFQKMMKMIILKENGEIWNFQGKFKIKEIGVELSIINGKFKILYYYNKIIIIKDEGDILKGKEMVKIKRDMFGELIFDGIAGLFHKEKHGYYTFIFNKCLIIEGKEKNIILWENLVLEDIF